MRKGPSLNGIRPQVDGSQLKPNLSSHKQVSPPIRVGFRALTSVVHEDREIEESPKKSKACFSILFILLSFYFRPDSILGEFFGGGGGVDSLHNRIGGGSPVEEPFS